MYDRLKKNDIGVVKVILFIEFIKKLRGLVLGLGMWGWRGWDVFKKF